MQALQAELALLTNSHEQLSEQVKAAAKDQQGLSALAEGLKVEVATLQQELDRAKVCAANGQQELSKLKDEAAQLREGLEQARAASSETSMSRAALQSHVEELEARASSLMERLADTETRARAQMEAARTEVTEADRVQAELRQRLACKEEEWDAREQTLRSKVRAASEQVRGPTIRLHRSTCRNISCSCQKRSHPDALLYDVWVDGGLGLLHEGRTLGSHAAGECSIAGCTVPRPGRNKQPPRQLAGGAPCSAFS